MGRENRFFDARDFWDLIPKRAGKIEVFDRDIDSLDDNGTPRHGAALGRPVPAGRTVSPPLTVKQNIQVPMREHLDLPEKNSWTIWQC